MVQKNPKNSPLFRDIQDQRFGRWKVVEFAGSKDGATWWCECECGTRKVVSASSLFQGSQSCGCLQRESAKQTAATLHLRRRRTEPRKTHGMSNSPEYRAWNQMIQRCTNTKLRNYKDYGGRGIAVCDRWSSSFENFYSDLGRRPTCLHSLDRINNDGNYEPGNVRWATDKQQRSNSRHPNKFEFQGEMLSIAELSRKAGIPYRTLRVRLMELGWTVERAVSQSPSLYHKRRT